MDELNLANKLKKFQDILQLPREMRWLQEGFTIVPNSILITQAPRELKMLYIVLLMFAFKKNNCFPGVLLLAKYLGITDRAIRKNLAKLVEMKWLKIEYRRGRTSVYTLLKV